MAAWVDGNLANPQSEPGAIGEAKARREEAAAHFRALQAQAITELEGALAGYRATRQQASTAIELSDDLRKRLNSVRSMREVGEVDSLAVADAQVEFNAGALARLDSLVKSQQAFAQVEDAVQYPLERESATE